MIEEDIKYLYYLVVNYKLPYLWLGTILSCIPVVQKLTLCPLKVSSVRLLLATPKISIIKTHFKKINKLDQKVRVWSLFKNGWILHKKIATVKPPPPPLPGENPLPEGKKKKINIKKHC